VAENSHISWTDNTFNPWIGCTKISPACDGCYAAHLMGGGRYSRVVWGEPGKGDGTRSRTAPSNWSKVRKWNKLASEAPGKTFVFCASLADVFDNAVEPEWRRDLFDLIRETPNLTYLLLTKRPQNIVRLFGQAMGFAGGDKEACRNGWPANAAIGTTIEDRKRLLSNAETLRLAGEVLSPAFTFWSCEPLLEDLGRLPTLPDWVIAGGETDQGAHKARPADPEWFRSLRDQCAAAGVPFHFKQWGEWQPTDKPSHWIGPAGIREVGSGVWASDSGIARLGKYADPCTLDRVKHLARPAGF
jgi:protein gp37